MLFGLQHWMPLNAPRTVLRYWMVASWNILTYRLNPGPSSALWVRKQDIPHHICQIFFLFFETESCSDHQGNFFRNKKQNHRCLLLKQINQASLRVVRCDLAWFIVLSLGSKSVKEACGLIPLSLMLRWGVDSRSIGWITASCTAGEISCLICGYQIASNRIA